MADLAEGARIAGSRDQETSEPVIELRIHGVGGTAPEDLLRNPHLRRVSGDRDAGFYRPASGVDADHREALSWGGLTSRDASRALWLLLLPFALVNMAGWMALPRPSGPRSTTRRESGWESPGKSLVRLFALSMTLLLVLATASIALDLIAYQCGRSQCAAQQWWTTLLARIGPDRPTARLAAGAVIPLAALGLVWAAGWRSYRRLEEFDVPHPPAPEDRRGLADPDFWRGAEPVGRLRILHVTAGVAAIALLLVWSVAVLDAVRGEGARIGDVWLPAPTSAFLAGLSLLLLAGLVVLLCRRVLSHRAPVPGLKRRLRAAAAGSGLLLALALLYAALPRGRIAVGAAEPASLELFVAAAGILAATQVLLVTGMLLVCWRRRAAARGAVFFGMGQPFVSTLAAVMLASLWAGSFIRLADVLGTPVAADVVEAVLPPGQQLPWSILVYPVWYRPVSIGFAAALVAGIVLVAAEWAGAWLRAAGHTATVRRDFCPELRKRFPEMERCPDPSAADGPLHRRLDTLRFADTRAPDQIEHVREQARRTEQRITEVARSYGLADIVRRADRWLLLAFALGVIGALLDIWLGARNWLLTGATWVVAWAPLFASATVFAGLRSPERRRGVAVIFDVITFWPRHHHPFAPPCYGERVIPQLAARLRRLTDDGRRGGVLLSTHSQGTVVAVACLLQEDLLGDSRDRVDLLTYGSPLIILYQRAFPAFFDAGTLKRLREDLQGAGGPSCWQHFYCPTDPLGVPMFSAPDGPPDPYDHRLLDPHTLLSPPGEPALPLARHSAYLDHPQLLETVARHIAPSADRHLTPDLSDDSREQHAEQR